MQVSLERAKKLSCQKPSVLSAKAPLKFASKQKLRVALEHQRKQSRLLQQRIKRIKKELRQKCVAVSDNVSDSLKTIMTVVHKNVEDPF